MRDEQASSHPPYCNRTADFVAVSVLPQLVLFKTGPQNVQRRFG